MEASTKITVRLPDGKRGYIRLTNDGRYSFRHYNGDTGIMSYGECR